MWSGVILGLGVPGVERNQGSGHVRSWSYDMGDMGIGGSGSGILVRRGFRKEKEIA